MKIKELTESNMVKIWEFIQSIRNNLQAGDSRIYFSRSASSPKA